MQRPNEAQIAGAMAILRTFARQTPSAAENIQRTAIYSIISALGGPGNIHADYENAVKEATQPGDVKIGKHPVVSKGDGEYEVTAENYLGLPVGTYFLEGAEIEDDEDDTSEGGDGNDTLEGGDGSDTTGGGDGTDELPDAAALGRMTKAEIAAQAEAEQIEGVNPDTQTKDEMIETIMDARELDEDDDE